MNKVSRAWIFLIAHSIGLILLGQAIAGREGLLWGLVLSLSINTLIYLYADEKVVNFFRGKALEGNDPWGALKTTRELCNKTKLPMPQVIIFQNDSPQALAVGRSWEHSAIILSSGLLETLSSSELEAIIAFNLTCIKKQDTLSSLIATTLCGLALTISQFLDSIMRWLIGAKKEKYSAQSHFFTYCISPFCYLILKFTVNEQSYFKSDELAAKLISDPRNLANALWKLESYANTRPFAAPASYAHLFVVNPLTSKGWTRYFQAQPSIKRRIKKIIGYYPI